MEKSPWYKKRSIWFRLIIGATFSFLVTFYSLVFFSRTPNLVEGIFFTFTSFIYLPMNFVLIYIGSWTGIDFFLIDNLHWLLLHAVANFFYALLVIWVVESIVLYVKQVITKKQLKPKKIAVAAFMLVLILIGLVWYGIDLSRDQYFEKNGILYFGSQLPTEYSGIVENADIDTFQSLDCKYGKDINSVFARNGIIPDADPNTFTVLSCRYTRDINHVFFFNKSLELADPETFEIVGEIYGKDKDHVFLGNKILELADPETFEIVGETYGKDKDHVFYRDRIILSADPETFEAITPMQEDAHARDKNYIFVYSSPKPLN